MTQPVKYFKNLPGFFMKNWSYFFHFSFLVYIDIALLAVIRLNINLNPQYDYLVSLESSGYREFHGINPQIIPNITTPGPGIFSCQISQHFLPRIATVKTELPDITRNCHICAFSAFFKIVWPFCHNDVLELWKGFHILFPHPPIEFSMLWEEF